MKYWVSKYALTKGVFEIEGRLTGDGRYVSQAGHYGFFAVGRDAHEGLAGANSAAEKMRVKKLDALRRQIAKLEKMSFTKEGA